MTEPEKAASEVTAPAEAAPADDKPKESTASPTPIFGAGFSSSTGFGGFTGVTSPAPADDDDDKHPEEECKAEFKPLVQLDEVEANTGEEDEDCLLELKAKLYRFEKDSSEWKERGIGQAKFLQSRETKKIRFLMRQEKTLKIRANHLVMPGTKLSSHAGNDKAWVWSAVDFADEEQKIEMFAIRFGSVERANEFKKMYEEAMDKNAALLKADGVEVPTADAKDTEGDVEEAAEALSKAAVA